MRVCCVLGEAPAAGRPPTPCHRRLVRPTLIRRGGGGTALFDGTVRLLDRHLPLEPVGVVASAGLRRRLDVEDLAGRRRGWCRGRRSSPPSAAPSSWRPRCGRPWSSPGRPPRGRSGSRRRRRRPADRSSCAPRPPGRWYLVFVEQAESHDVSSALLGGRVRGHALPCNHRAARSILAPDPKPRLAPLPAVATIDRNGAGRGWHGSVGGGAEDSRLRRIPGEIAALAGGGAGCRL